MNSSDDAETATKLNRPAPLPENTLPPPRIWPQYIVTIAATLTFFAIATVGATPPRHQPEGIPSFDKKHWFISIELLGAAAGAPLLGLVAHLCGRKWAAVLIQLLSLLALCMKQITHDEQYLSLSSYILGSARGGAFAIIPIYVTEIADDIHRGVLGIFILGMSVFGGFSTVVVTFEMEYWLKMFICTLPSLLVLGAAILMPETPPFLISKGRQNEAAKVLRFLRGEYRQEWETQVLESSFSEKASVLKPFMISLGLMTLQSLGGHVYGFMAAVDGLMEIVGGIALSAVITTLFGTACLIGAAAAVYFIKWRLLLFISCIGITVGSFMICLSYNVFYAPFVQLLGGLLTIASFFVAAGYLPYIVMVQLLPRNNNAITCSLITAFCSFLNFLQRHIFDSVVGFEYDMIFVTVVSALLTIYVFLFIPEMKRKPVQTIQDELSHKSFIMLTL